MPIPLQFNSPRQMASSAAFFGVRRPLLLISANVAVRNGDLPTSAFEARNNPGHAATLEGRAGGINTFDEWPQISGPFLLAACRKRQRMPLRSLLISGREDYRLRSGISHTKCSTGYAHLLG